MNDQFLSPSDPGWPAMWQALKNATGDYDDANERSGERWQYMGTYDNVHQFRHRDRPAGSQQILKHGGRTCDVGIMHRDRVYVWIDAESLEVIRVMTHHYNAEIESGRAEPPAAIADSRAIGERTEAGRDANRELAARRRRESFSEDYAGAFDGFSVISDADPGL